MIVFLFVRIVSQYNLYQPGVHYLAGLHGIKKHRIQPDFGKTDQGIHFVLIVQDLPSDQVGMERLFVLRFKGGFEYKVAFPQQRIEISSQRPVAFQDKEGTGLALVMSL